MRQAFEQLDSEFGQDLVDRYQQNARAIINGDNVPLNELQKIRKKHFWLF
jgi:protein-tyrosine phosphatase